MLKILQARFQQFVNLEFPDVQAGFRKCRGTIVQIANIQWEFAVCLRELKQRLCINLEGWDGEGDGRKVLEGGHRYTDG